MPRAGEHILRHPEALQATLTFLAQTDFVPTAGSSPRRTPIERLDMTVAPDIGEDCAPPSHGGAPVDVMESAGDRSGDEASAGPWNTTPARIRTCSAAPVGSAATTRLICGRAETSKRS